MPDSYYGLYSGEVKDNSDADKLGRLQVSIPSIFPEDEVMTARSALPYGSFFVPEVGAFVWIAFEGGRPGLPVWLGVQQVPDQAIAEADVDPPEKRLFKTAGGHLLMLDDKSGEEHIEIKDGVNGHTVTLDDQGVKIVDAANTQELTMSSSSATLKGNGHEVTLTSSGVTVKTSSGAKVELTSSGITIESSGIVNVKGSLLKLNDGVLPVARITDQGVGNLGAPVVILPPGNTTVLA
jgi:Type VI secretion system/phage-baseplate injector OB domain